MRDINNILHVPLFMNYFGLGMVIKKMKVCEIKIGKTESEKINRLKCECNFRVICMTYKRNGKISLGCQKWK